MPRKKSVRTESSPTEPVVEPEGASVVALEAAASEPVVEAPVTSEPDPTPAPKRGKKKAKAAPTDATLAQVADGYLKALEDEGKSTGTVFSYRVELLLAQSELGAETLVRELTTERVAAFFACERVTMTRAGRPKSQLSVDKTRRVLRQALGWAQAVGLIEEVPVPVAVDAA